MKKSLYLVELGCHAGSCPEVVFETKVQAREYIFTFLTKGQKHSERIVRLESGYWTNTTSSSFGKIRKIPFVAKG